MQGQESDEQVGFPFKQVRGFQLLNALQNILIGFQRGQSSGYGSVGQTTVDIGDFFRQGPG